MPNYKGPFSHFNIKEDVKGTYLINHGWLRVVQINSVQEAGHPGGRLPRSMSRGRSAGNRGGSHSEVGEE